MRQVARAVRRVLAEPAASHVKNKRSGISDQRSAWPQSWLV